MTNKLSGDLAYDLFMSPASHPLRDFLISWKAGEIEGQPDYIIAVIAAYKGMLSRCDDGRYSGKVRNV